MLLHFTKPKTDETTQIWIWNLIKWLAIIHSKRYKSMFNWKWLYFVFNVDNCAVHTIQNSKGQILDYADCCKMSCICGLNDTDSMPICFSKLIHFCLTFFAPFVPKEKWSSEKFRIVHRIYIGKRSSKEKVQTVTKKIANRKKKKRISIHVAAFAVENNL